MRLTRGKDAEDDLTDNESHAAMMRRRSGTICFGCFAVDYMALLHAKTSEKQIN